MSAPPQQRALYLDAGEHRAFAQFHGAADPGAALLGVVMAPPFGWESMCSHRPRRAWAEQLAAAGMPTLSVEFPGGGDSTGAPGDPGQLDAWTATIDAAATWLRGEAGCARVAVLGIGMGGLVAARAIAGGAAVDDLVLWNVPGRGPTLLRELQAFARFETAMVPDEMVAGDPRLPEGALAVGGYTLSPATVADLRALDLSAVDQLVPAGMRVLLLARDDLRPDATLVAALEAAGAQLTVGDGPGYGAMTAEPTESVAPSLTMARVSAWLAAAPSAGRPSPLAAVPALDALDFQVDGMAVRETPITITGAADGASLFGIIAEPATRTTDVCAVLLNAGALTHIGPNRMWVEASRRWAGLGIPSLRLDIEGIGDADGNESVYRDVGAFYTDELVRQVRAALDTLVARGLPARFALLGLCSGAYWAFHGAIDDERVCAAYLVNPRALLWDLEFQTMREARKLRKLLRPSMWRKVIDPRRSTTSPRVVLAAVGRRIADRVRRLGARARGRELPPGSGATLDDCFDRLAATGTRGVFVFTGDEPLYEELERDGYVGRLANWPGIELELLARSPVTHTLRPIWCQQRVHAALDAAVRRDAGLD